jgi:hypothetical protein
MESWFCIWDIIENAINFGNKKWVGIEKYMNKKEF